MNTLETVRALLGWCSVLSVGFLLFTTILLLLFRPAIARIHGRMFGLSEADLSRAYFQYLAQLKIMVIVFNLVPYIALRIIA